MKFTPEVVAALEVLRAAAENDFERHRLDVLERDMPSPPAPEIIDERCQKFLGIEFTKKAKGYFTRDMRIHRLIWQYCHGDIPAGYEIHHADNDTSNNNASNLLIMKSGEHQKLHRKFRKKKKFTCVECGCEYEAQDTGKNRFCSERCASTYYRREYSADERYTETKICEWCGKEFKTTKYTGARFCSQQCISSATYHQIGNNPFIDINANR